MLAQRIISSEAVEDIAIPASVQQQIMHCVYQQSGIYLSELTCQFVETRLRRRLRALGMDTPEQYMAYFDSHADEAEQLVNAFTTNETSFFRTKPLWRFLANDFFKDLVERQGAVSPSFWSAACSTGEEAYSLAMLSEDVFSELGASLMPRVYASDISTDVLAKAREGRYSGRNIKRLDATRPEMLKAYFEQDGDEHRVCASIRKRVQFAQHNLMEESGKREAYDLVMLRNVLIYFSQEDQMRIVGNMVSSMRPGAVLAIGESESLGFFDSGLEYVQPFVYRKPEV